MCLKFVSYEACKHNLVAANNQKNGLIKKQDGGRNGKQCLIIFLQPHLAFLQCHVGPTCVPQVSALPALLFMKLLVPGLPLLPKASLCIAEQRQRGMHYLLKNLQSREPGFHYASRQTFLFSKVFRSCSQSRFLTLLAKLSFLSDPPRKLWMALHSTMLRILLSPCYCLRFMLPSPSVHVDKCKGTSSYYGAP